MTTVDHNVRSVYLKFMMQFCRRFDFAGYNKDDSEYGLPYYIVKNSWATSFGMDGFFLIEMGKNMCGLSDCASFPNAF